jgi:hypothetical protein
MDDRRVAKDGWCAGEVVKESNSGAKKNRRDVTRAQRRAAQESWCSWMCVGV